MCLDSALDLWPPGHFELGFSLLGRAVRKWSVQPCFLSGLGNLEIDNSLKWPRFNKISVQKTSDAL